MRLANQDYIVHLLPLHPVSSATPRAYRLIYLHLRRLRSIYKAVAHSSWVSPTPVTVSPTRSTSYYIDPSTFSTIERTPHRSSLRRLNSRRSPTMPGTIEIVEPPLVVRDLHADELLVLEDFERHANHCSQCTTALNKNPRALCELGKLRSVDVTKYLYSQGGKPFSTVDRESGRSMRVKLPRESPAIRSLLGIVEDTTRTQSPRRGRAPPVRPISGNYESQRPIVHHIEPRPRTPETGLVRQIIERSPSTSSSRRHSIVYQSPRSSPSRSPSSRGSRGSLYTFDHLDRSERRYESSRIYRLSDSSR